jgi:hypothetical protein
VVTILNPCLLAASIMSTARLASIFPDSFLPIWMVSGLSGVVFLLIAGLFVKLSRDLITMVITFVAGLLVIPTLQGINQYVDHFHAPPGYLFQTWTILIGFGISFGYRKPMAAN